MQKVAVFVAVLTCLVGMGIPNASADSVGGGSIGYSLSSTGDLGGKPVSKELVLSFDDFHGSRLLFSNEALSCFLGDTSGNGTENAPENIDALHVDFGVYPSYLNSLFLSTSKDECGVKDGDVITFDTAGGMVTYLSESYFVDITGATDGNVDVDAFTRAPDGTLYFSFADNEDSNLLPGSQPGEIRDGDILRLDTYGDVVVLYSEDDVSQMVTTAVGSSISVGDVLSLAYDWSYSSLLFTVQSPSQYDATVFSDMDGGCLVPGYDETVLGYTNAVEIDALSLLPTFSDMPCVEVEPRYPQQGDTLKLTVSRGDPNSFFFLLLSGALAAVPYPPFAGGFGSLPLDVTDVIYTTYITQCCYLSGTFDAEGIGTFEQVVPMDPSAIDIHVQAVDPLNRIYSHPITLELNQ